MLLKRKKFPKKEAILKRTKIRGSRKRKPIKEIKKAKAILKYTKAI